MCCCSNRSRSTFKTLFAWERPASSAIRSVSAAGRPDVVAFEALMEQDELTPTGWRCASPDLHAAAPTRRIEPPRRPSIAIMARIADRACERANELQHALPKQIILCGACRAKTVSSAGFLEADRRPRNYRLHLSRKAAAIRRRCQAACMRGQRSGLELEFTLPSRRPRG